MIAERTYEVSLIRDILMEPEIHARITDDSHAQLDIDVDAESWVKMVVDDEIIGVYCLHPLNRWTLQIHAHVLAQYRDKHALDTGKAILKWFLEHTDYLKIVAEIPVCFPDVLKFTQKFGFKVEGCNRQSLMKDNKLIDQVWLGITRDEVESYFRSAKVA